MGKIELNIVTGLKRLVPFVGCCIGPEHREGHRQVRNRCIGYLLRRLLSIQNKQAVGETNRTSWSEVFKMEAGSLKVVQEWDAAVEA